MMKAIILMTMITLGSLNSQAASFFEVYGKVKSFGIIERSGDDEVNHYIEIEKKSGVRYRVFLNSDTFDRLKREKGEITLSAELKNIYGNYGKGRIFYSLIGGNKL